MTLIIPATLSVLYLLGYINVGTTLALTTLVSAVAETITLIVTHINNK